MLSDEQASAIKARADIPALLAEREELQWQLAEAHAREAQLRAALEAAEWGWWDRYQDDGCPVCRARKENGKHEPNCPVGQALSSTSGAAAEAVRAAGSALAWAVEHINRYCDLCGGPGPYRDCGHCPLGMRDIERPLAALREHFPGLLPAEDTT